MKNLISIFSVQFSQKVLIFVISIFLVRYHVEYFIDFSLLRSIFGMVDSFLLAPAMLSMYLSKNKAIKLNIFLVISTILILSIYLLFRFDFKVVYFMLIIAISLNQISNGLVIGKGNTDKMILSSIFLLLSFSIYLLHNLLNIEVIFSIFSLFLIGRFILFHLSSVSIVSKIQISMESMTIYVYTLGAMFYLYFYREWVLSTDPESFISSEVVLQSGVLIQLAIGAFLTKLLIYDDYLKVPQRVMLNTCIIYIFSIIMFYFMTVVLGVLYQEQFRLDPVETALVGLLPSFSYSTGYYYRFMLKLGHYKAICIIVLAALLISIVCILVLPLPFLVVMIIYPVIQGIFFSAYNNLDIRGDFA